MLQLPMSFISSFFALGVKEFPRDSSGNTAWPLKKVSGYLCTCPHRLTSLHYHRRFLKRIAADWA